MTSYFNSRVVAWAVWMTASIFYAYQYIIRVMPNIMLDDIMQRFHIDAATYGQFSGVYYIGYSLMHLPIGIMLDRFGPKKIMSGAILLSVMGLLPLIFTEHWLFPIFGRVVIGMGSSAAILGVFKIVRIAFSEAQFPRMLSLSVTIGLVGAIYGGAPVSYMRDAFGFDGVVIFFALLGVALAIATFFIVPHSESESKSAMWSDIKEVLGNRKMILASLFAGFMVGPLEGFADVWGTVFFKQVYGYESALAASLPSMIFIGMCFGSPILSFIAEKTGSFPGTIIFAGSAMFVSFVGMLFGQMSPLALSISFILVGICSAYQILAIYRASTYVREQVAGLATAVANMIIMIFGYAFHSAIGGVVNYMGGPSTPAALIFGVAVVPAALCIGTMGFIGLTMLEKRNTLAVAQ